MILDYNTFLDTIFEKLKELQIDVSNYALDHLGYQTSSPEDYDNLKLEFSKLGELISEDIVGGRRVGGFLLSTPILYKELSIPAIELIEPKSNQICPSALEHVEFVLNEGFEEFLQKYPNVQFDTSKMDQPKFPMINLKLGENIQAKFHLKPVIEIWKE